MHKTKKVMRIWGQSQPSRPAGRMLSGLSFGRAPDIPADKDGITLKLQKEEYAKGYEPLIRIYRGDITEFRGHAIVNAANPTMLGGAGVDGAIHSAAGRKLKDACGKYQPFHVGHNAKERCPTGDAKLTKAFDLPAKWVIHTVGPRYDGGSDERRRRSKEDLELAYMNSLALADNIGCETIAFPAISCGIYGYPAQASAEVAFGACWKNMGDIKEAHFILFEPRVYTAFIKAAELFVAGDYALDVTNSAAIASNAAGSDRSSADANQVPALATDEAAAPGEAHADCPVDSPLKGSQQKSRVCAPSEGTGELATVSRTQVDWGEDEEGTALAHPEAQALQEFGGLGASKAKELSCSTAGCSASSLMEVEEEGAKLVSHDDPSKAADPIIVSIGSY